MVPGRRLADNECSALVTPHGVAEIAVKRFPYSVQISPFFRSTSFGGVGSILGPEMRSKRVKSWAFPLLYEQAFRESALAAGQKLPSKAHGFSINPVNDRDKRQTGHHRQELVFASVFRKIVAHREASASASACDGWSPARKSIKVNRRTANIVDLIKTSKVHSGRSTRRSSSRRIPLRARNPFAAPPFATIFLASPRPFQRPHAAVRGIKNAPHRTPAGNFLPS